MIEKLGITPLERYYNPLLEQDIWSSFEIRDLESKRNEMLEALIGDIGLYDAVIETMPLKNEALKMLRQERISIIEKATGKTWEEIKEIIK